MHRLGIVLLLVVAVGCGRGQADIPDGGQQLHVTVDDTGISLDPPAVRAGDVYVVMDTPGSSVGFVQRQGGADAPGPMSEADLERFASGDLQGTAISGFSDTGCSAEQRAEDRGRLGPCGNVVLVVLTEGKYAFFTTQPDGVTPALITILEVRP